MSSFIPLVISHCDYVRERLKEHLGNPTSNNVLSEAACENILARLDKELGVLSHKTHEEPVRGESGAKETKCITMIRANQTNA